MNNQTVKYIEAHGYRVVDHSDHTATIYVLIGNDKQGYSEVPYHVRSLNQARAVMGY